MASVIMAKSFGESIMENLMYFQPNEMALWLRLVPQLELTGTSSNPGMVIYVFNCEHFLCVYEKCEIITKQKFADFIKKVVDFQNLMKIEFCWKLIFENLIIHKPSLWSCLVPHKTLIRFVQPF